MRIHIDSGGEHSFSQDPADTIHRVHNLLADEADPTRKERLETLTNIFQNHTPPAYISSFPAEQIAAWVKQFLSLIEDRRAEQSVRVFPFGEKGQSLLLSNSENIPFLLDSIQSYLSGQVFRYQLLEHPILTVKREGGEVKYIGAAGEGGPLESLIVIEMEGVKEELFSKIEHGVESVIKAVRDVHNDQAALMESFLMLGNSADTEREGDFFHWLQDGNFIPFSYRTLKVSKDGGGRVTVQEMEGSRLGLPPDPQELTCCKERLLTDFDASFQDRILREEKVVIEEIERTSPVLRSDKLVWVGSRVKEDENIWEEHIFLGLFSSKSVDELAVNIPPLWDKIEKAVEALSISIDSYDYRKIIEIFNAFPKPELFFMPDDEVVRTIRSFVTLYRQGQIKVVATPGMAVKGITLMVIMPREFYSGEALVRTETYLGRYFSSPPVKSQIVHISPDYLSILFRIKPKAEDVYLDVLRLESGLTRITRPWKLKLGNLLERQCGEQEGLKLWGKYKDTFSLEYRSVFHPRFAVRDIKGVEKVLASGEEVLDLWGSFKNKKSLYRLQFYSPKKANLNELMPFLENLNLCVVDEVDFSLCVDDRKVFIKSFIVSGGSGDCMNLSKIRGIFLEILAALRKGEVENDYLNRLLVLTGLSWREIDVFRGYRNYYFQLGSPFTKKRVAFALINNPQVAFLLFRYFEGRFSPAPKWEDPLKREEEALSPIRQELITALQSVSDINEDQILRTLFNLIDSTVRTNFFVRRDKEDYFFSFKISAIGIIDMPAPRPMYEIYVHSAEMEGIHLRGGKVARGGIRWSDRPDDFRTEILGLMKTQMTKNSLIVPVGSKGGFVVKTPYATREEGAALSKEAYVTLMRGLLDLTDNRLGDKIARPKGVVAYDEQDPYLVVAADKGTAHLPDTANGISQDYNFWLDDAFASGGSHGYDHKKLGITARGAWVCVRRHFQEMGMDIQSEPFTVVGIGDMSGDVFGNGMLLSRKIRLLAAFDHRHIFIDPDPDPETSFNERERLFSLPRSSWEDYNRDLISEGGGVYSRDAKDIPLSPQVRNWLGVRHEYIDSQGLIRLLLTADVDLLWNGGIGTYVKAGNEKNEDVGDRSNDAVRVDASQLKARVLGEGGNLGLTQKARIEYAMKGGRINTDAVDNSAGVDCSDHEVNLKIFMQYLKEKGVVSSQAERDVLLEKLTDDVCEAVLANNYGQSICLSLDMGRSAANIEPFLSLTDRLVGAGLLDRKGEFLPTEKDILARKNQNFTRPELSILMAYSKMQVYQALLENEFTNTDYLLSYFPLLLREKYETFLTEHPLKKEIAATVITNVVVNQSGCSFVNQLARKTDTSLVTAVNTYLVFDKVLDGESLRRQIYALDNRMTTERQYYLLGMLEDALASLSCCALEHDILLRLEKDEIYDLKEKMDAFVKTLGGILPDSEWGKCKALASSLEEEGLPSEQAGKISTFAYMDDFLPVVNLVSRTDYDLYSVARTFNEVRDRLGVKGILESADMVQVRDRWDRMTLQAAKAGFASAIFKLTLGVLQESEGNLEAFLGTRRQKFNYYSKFKDLLRGTTPANFHPFTVVLNALEELVG